MASLKNDKSTNPLFYDENNCDFASRIKTAFSRKLYGIIAGHLILGATLTSILMFTPLSRFYINENEWLLNLLVILLILMYVAVFLKRDNYNINIFLQILHMILQVSTIAVFITFYDLLGVLQGIFLATCGISFLFLYSLLFRKSCELCMAIFFSVVIVLTAAVLFQMVFGCTNEEFITSVILSVFLSLYYLYSVNLVTHSVSYDKFCVAVITINVWPVIVLTTKINFLTLK
ncbi:uncharacterized protein TNIN_267871 [Trichonephila inaurata madagascariensis]|uniref:Uncharacterized protein n=1 Tax=Trichonephila inaurata madagascariensis TaxID=2747483 RepID=A0A8X7BT50_9ARAC|nr:uncharacterized protein TNIN_267871 [Trichonephila inaurata madagascariensis]